MRTGKLFTLFLSTKLKIFKIFENGNTYVSIPTPILSDKDIAYSRALDAYKDQVSKVI